jgi:regulatory protein
MIEQKRKSTSKRRILPRVSKAEDDLLPGVNVTSFSAVDEAEDLANLTRLKTSPSCMRSVDPIPPSLIEEWALSYLDRYATSAANLRQVLLRRARRRLGRGTQIGKEVSEAIDALIVRYRAARLLDDAAYAGGQVRRGLARGRSLRQIAAGLQAKGVGADEAAAVLAALREGTADPDLAVAIAFARRRGFGPFRRAPNGGADSRRALAAFARAGFTRRTASRVLAARDEVEVTALLDDRD